jgi:hypothetical protein
MTPDRFCHPFRVHNSAGVIDLEQRADIDIDIGSAGLTCQMQMMCAGF